MSTSASVLSVSEFGKDLGVVHEAVITGRKVGAGRTFWSRLAHNEDLFRRIVREVMQMVVATQPFDPVSFIGKGFSLVPEEHDARCDSLTEIDFSSLVFLETCLKENEPSIKGEEKLTRLKAVKDRIRLDATVFAGLWADYQEHAVDSVLECLYTERGITYVHIIRVSNTFVL